MQLRKKARLFYNLNKEAGLVNLGRSRYWRGAALTGKGSYSGHFLNAVSTHPLGPEEAFAVLRASTQAHSRLLLLPTLVMMTFS